MYIFVFCIVDCYRVAKQTNIPLSYSLTQLINCYIRIAQETFTSDFFEILEVFQDFKKVECKY